MLNIRPFVYLRKGSHKRLLNWLLLCRSLQKKRVSAEVGVSNWLSGGRRHSPPNLHLPPLPSGPFRLLHLPPLFPSALFPDSMLPGAGDSAGTMGWYHRSAPSCWYECCTIMECCSSIVAHCEFCDSEKTVQKRETERERKKSMLLNWDWRKEKGRKS